MGGNSYSKDAGSSRFSSSSGSRSGSSHSKSHLGYQFSSSRSGSRPRSGDSYGQSKSMLGSKSKDDKHEKHIFERIAAGEQVTDDGPYHANNPPSSKAALVKDGSRTHGHVLRTGHYRLSPGFQKVRKQYNEKQQQDDKGGGGSDSGLKNHEQTNFSSSRSGANKNRSLTADEAIARPVPKSGDRDTVSKSGTNKSGSPEDDGHKSADQPFFKMLSARPKPSKPRGIGSKSSLPKKSASLEKFVSKIGKPKSSDCSGHSKSSRKSTEENKSHH